MMLAVVSITSCMHNEKKLITEKIQYDVNIKSPDPDYDWWIQNLPGPERDNLVNMIMDGALSGKYKVFDYYNQPLSPEAVKMMMADTIYYTIMDEEPPYQERDTMVINKILREDITRIRFLEEWTTDPETMQVYKKVLGIAPIARRPDLMGMERWQPLFWIYTDKNFVEGLNEVKE